jgi:hypothetical protein
MTEAYVSAHKIAPTIEAMLRGLQKNKPENPFSAMVRACLPHLSLPLCWQLAAARRTARGQCAGSAGAPSCHCQSIASHATLRLFQREHLRLLLLTAAAWLYAGRVADRERSR